MKAASSITPPRPLNVVVETVPNPNITDDSSSPLVQKEEEEETKV
jgi:hypothetical protein